MSDDIQRSATLSADGRYRYLLERRWDEGPALLFVMLNPSTADAEVDDPTIRRCIGFARRDGYPAVEVVNLYAFRATRPHRLVEAHEDGHDVIGPRNDDAVREAANAAARVVFAWGGSVTKVPTSDPRVDRISRIVDEHHLPLPLVLGWTAAGHPRHPLYVRADTPMEVVS